MASRINRHVIFPFLDGFEPNLILQFSLLLGLHLRIATNPWSHHVLADNIPETDPDFSESNKYRNYWGYEIEMLKNVANILNFTYTIENPPDGKWGHIGKFTLCLKIVHRPK